jgi:hypothetical protein
MSQIIHYWKALSQSNKTTNDSITTLVGRYVHLLKPYISSQGVKNR